MKLQQQVQTLARAYVRKDGKDNRRQQAARMMAFVAHAEGLGAREIGQVGGRHVVSYWKACGPLVALQMPPCTATGWQSGNFGTWLASQASRLAPSRLENNQRGARPEEGGGGAAHGVGGPQARRWGSVRPPLESN